MESSIPPTLETGHREEADLIKQMPSGTAADCPGYLSIEYGLQSWLRELLLLKYQQTDQPVGIEQWPKTKENL